MMRKYWSCAACVVLSLISFAFPSCKGLSIGSSVKDSDSVKQAETDNVMLPDTAFQSVENLSFNVEVLDTATSGKLNSLADPYQDVEGILTFRGGPRRDART